jgi:succinate dehydrogenase/fumarate reductase cytochrome b subunit
MRESQIMFLQYMTGLLVLVFGSFHFLLISFLAPTPDKVLYSYGGTGYTHVLVGGTLYYTVVKAVYSTLIWGSIFELLLTVLVFHIFNGFRIILSEQFQGERTEKFITYSLLVLALIIFIWGSRTIVLMLSGGA